MLKCFVYWDNNRSVLIIVFLFERIIQYNIYHKSENNYHFNFIYYIYCVLNVYCYFSKHNALFIINNKFIKKSKL